MLKLNYKQVPETRNDTNRRTLTTMMVKSNINTENNRLLEDMHCTEPGCKPEYRTE